MFIIIILSIFIYSKAKKIDYFIIKNNKYIQPNISIYNGNSNTYYLYRKIS